MDFRSMFSKLRIVQTSISHSKKICNEHVDKYLFYNQAYINLSDSCLLLNWSEYVRSVVSIGTLKTDSAKFYISEII